MADSKILVLVTGASGFTAAHVVKQLLLQGYCVRGTVRNLNDQAKVGPLRKLCPDAKYPLELVEANLTDASAWPRAVAGCTYVIHVASPVPFKSPRHEDDVIRPAVEGTLSVLNACREAKTVKRVVLTSSLAAIASYPPTTDPARVLTESNWNNLDNPDQQAYIKSKGRAEKAAWDYVASLPAEEKFELAVINPGLILGPVLTCGDAAVIQIPKMIILKQAPLIPNVTLVTVDVRDVAEAHIRAMTLPEAAGHRHLLTTISISMKEMADIIGKEFQPQGYKVPTKIAPNFLLKFAALFDRSVALVVPFLDYLEKCDNTRMTKVLGIKPRDTHKAVIDMCYSMIESGFVKKTAQYKGPSYDIYV